MAGGPGKGGKVGWTIIRRADCTCGHRFIDHAPNWFIVPAPAPCTECDCQEYEEA